jgi:trans-2,3-dihydro-3-hydroxyanthranilate isomerase
VASVCGISRNAIETANHRPCIASCGAPFILAELKSRAALAATSPNGDVFRLEVTKHPAVSIMIHTQIDEGAGVIRSRPLANLVLGLIRPSKGDKRWPCMSDWMFH